MFAHIWFDLAAAQGSSLALKSRNIIAGQMTSTAPRRPNTLHVGAWLGVTKTVVLDRGLIRRRGPRRSFEAVGCAPLEWTAWLNSRRLLEAGRHHAVRRSRVTLRRHAGGPDTVSVTHIIWLRATPVRFRFQCRNGHNILEFSVSSAPSCASQSPNNWSREFKFSLPGAPLLSKT